MSIEERIEELGRARGGFVKIAYIEQPDLRPPIWELSTGGMVHRAGTLEAVVGQAELRAPTPAGGE